MKKQERILKALANRRRLVILKILKSKRELCVAEIAEEIKLSFKATSKHLAILYASDILERRQVGLHVLYRLCDAPHDIVRTVIDNI